MEAYEAVQLVRFETVSLRDILGKSISLDGAEAFDRA